MEEDAYEAKRLGDESPCPKKTAHDETTQNRLDLWDTTVLRIDSVLLNKNRGAER